MSDNVQSIYKTAREFAGLTQERASAALNVSVRTLAAYETGERIPHDDIVVRMVDLYNYQQLAVQHMRANSELARRIVPDLKQRSVMEATIRFANSINRMAKVHGVDRLMEIAEDNQIDSEERAEFDSIVNEMSRIILSAMELSAFKTPEEEVE